MKIDLKGYSLSEYSGSRDNNFNLIRFIAAVAVLVSHSFDIPTGTNVEPFRRFLGMSLGNMAVDIFFLLSGYLVIRSLLSRKKIISFLWARIVRIYPALCITVLFCVFIVGLSFTTLPVAEYLTHPQTLKYWLKNTVLVSGAEYNLPGVFENLPYEKTVNGSLWTLPFEVWFYFYLIIVFFITQPFVRKYGVKMLRVSLFYIGICVLATYIFNHFFDFASFRKLKLFSMFSIGIVFYLWRDKIVLSSKLSTILSVILLISSVSKDVFFVVYTISIPYLLFYLAYIPSGIIRKFNKLGDYSYGLYLYAFPVQQSISSLVSNVTIPTLILLSFVISICLSFISWHVIEKRCVSLKNIFSG